MSRVPHVAREGKKTKVLGEPRIIDKRDYDEMELDARLEVIRSLLPLGLIQVYTRIHHIKIESDFLNRPNVLDCKGNQLLER